MTRGNDGTVRPLMPRSFDSLSEAEEENGQSRIYLGIHWSFDKTEGIAQGRRVANYVFRNGSSHDGSAGIRHGAGPWEPGPAAFVGSGMLISTTSILDGKPVSRYLGVVTGEAIIGANVFRDMFAMVRDIVGGRSATYEKGLAEARQVALAEMQQRAAELGANAVIGVDLDYEVLGQSNGMLMVSCSGTAVVCS